jgi:hypothetical protein
VKVFQSTKVVLRKNKLTILNLSKFLNRFVVLVKFTLLNNEINDDTNIINEEEDIFN